MEHAEAPIHYTRVRPAPLYFYPMLRVPLLSSNCLTLAVPSPLPGGSPAHLLVIESRKAEGGGGGGEEGEPDQPRREKRKEKERSKSKGEVSSTYRRRRRRLLTDFWPPTENTKTHFNYSSCLIRREGLLSFLQDRSELLALPGSEVLLRFLAMPLSQPSMSRSPYSLFVV